MCVAACVAACVAVCTAVCACCKREIEGHLISPVKHCQMMLHVLSDNKCVNRDLYKRKETYIKGKLYKRKEI